MLPQLAWLTPSDFMRIRYSTAGGSRSLRSSEPIVVGSDSSCDVQFDDGRIEGRHAKIYPAGELWWVRDLGSHDGTFLDQECINVAPVMGRRTLKLGVDGPTIWLETKH